MNLVETSAIFKKILFSAAAVLMLYITYAIIRAPVISVYQALMRQKEPANPKFGKLSAPVFQFKKITNTNPQYILNTKDGHLPKDLPNKLPVFRLRQPFFSYEAGKNAQRTGLLLGYGDDSFKTSTSEEVYVWEDPAFNGKLKIGVHTRVIDLNLPLYGKADYYQTNVLTEELAVEQAKNFLVTAGRFSDLYYTGNTKVYLGKFVGSEVRPVDFNYETQIIRVDFFRRFNNYPIVGPDPYKGMLQVWVGAPKNPAYKQLIFPRIEAYQWEIVNKDEDQYATYPLVSVETAWKEVSNGRGVLAGVVAKDGNPFEPYVPIRIDKVLVNSIYLGYYDTPTLQTHMEPIYIFEGNYTTVGGGAGLITLYYPAISGDYILPVENPDNGTIPN